MQSGEEGPGQEFIHASLVRLTGAGLGGVGIGGGAVGGEVRGMKRERERNVFCN